MPKDPDLGSIDRPRSVRVPLTEDEFRTWKLLAARKGQKLTDMLRSLVEREAAEARRQGFRTGKVEE